MHGVQVINLRGSYLKQLFRDPVLKLWRAGVNMRMSEDNQESPDLTYIKSCPQILNLAFFHALQQATARGGEAWAAVAERMRDRLSRLQKVDRSEQLVAHVRNFLGRWSVRMGDAAVESMGGAPVWLDPGRSDLQRSGFTEDFSWNQGAPRRPMEDAIWRELVRLIDPQQLLVSVIADYRNSGDRKDLRAAGLGDKDIDAALSEWEGILTGTEDAEEGETDEAQDLSYPELCFAMACTEPVLCASTVAGDPFQRMRWENGLASLELLKPGEGRRFEVRCNYRQTRPLMEWVGRLAALLYPGQPVAATSSDKDGPAPSVEWVDRPEKAAPRIAHHIKAWYGSAREPFVAVLLVGYESQAIVGLVKALRNRLQDADLAAEFFDNGRLIERGKVSIAEVPSVKGHEFDAVVVSVSPSACALLDSGDPRAIHIRNQLYVA